MSDLISRSALLDIFPPTEFGFSALVRYRIINAPAVDAVEVVYGEWILCGNIFEGYFKCSVCEKSICQFDDDGYEQRFNRCPNCGAKMDGEPKEGKG